MGSQVSTSPNDVDLELQGANPENPSPADALEAEITQARQRLAEAEANMMELQKRLDEYINRERQVAEVMIAAQISAQKTEAQARARAETVLQESDQVLRMKQKELELLQLKASAFKEDIVDRLAQYKSAVDSITIPVDDAPSMPGWINDEKKTGQKLIG